MVSHSGRRTAAATRTSLTSKVKKPAAHKRSAHDHDWATFRMNLGVVYGRVVAGHTHVFSTDASGLYETYLKNLGSERGVHTCNACRRFIESYGGLVTIAHDGQLKSLFWDERVAPHFYGAALVAMRKKVESAKVTGVFLSSDMVWGQPITGPWTHLSVNSQLVYRERALDAHQAMANVKHRVETVATALREFSAVSLDQVLQILNADAVSRAEKFVGPMQWLRDLHDRPAGKRGGAVLWKRVAAAPEGYCHPRASAAGTLMEDLQNGLPFADAQRRFNAKLHPLAYQRPQAAPSAQTIKQAEDLVAKLGLESALQRRFARLEDLETYWEPRVAQAARKASGGVFRHVKAKGDVPVPGVKLPMQTMTWEKFSRKILPSAEEIQFMVPAAGQFLALTAPVDPNAERLFKWDNPIAWYVYPNGASAQQFNLRAGAHVRVNAITQLPTMWGSDPKPYIANGVVLVLDGCRDTANGGLGLFPEIIRDDLHGIRSVVEAHSKAKKLQGAAQATACGYDFRASPNACSGELVVLAGGTWNRYCIDRWD